MYLFINSFLLYTSGGQLSTASPVSIILYQLILKRDPARMKRNFCQKIRRRPQESLQVYHYG